MIHNLPWFVFPFKKLCSLCNWFAMPIKEISVILFREDSFIDFVQRRLEGGGGGGGSRVLLLDVFVKMEVIHFHPA